MELGGVTSFTRARTSIFKEKVAVTDEIANRRATRTGRIKSMLVTELGRRGCLVSLATIASSKFEIPESKTALLQKYLKKSEENKEKNKKERLDGYYKRNYKDYFEFIEGSIKAKKDELSESEKGILDWLEANK